MSRRVGDRDGLIKEATAKAIATNDMKKLDGQDAYTAFFDVFEPVFDGENAVIEKGKKMKYPQGLPNYTIGIFLLASQKVKLLNFYNLTVPCVRQTRGDLYGVYKPIITKGDDKYFDNLVNEYKSSATSKDCDEIRRIIMSEAIYGDYGDKLHMTEDPALVPCCNGVYHMYTKEFIDWEESDKRGQVFTNKLAIDYNPNAQDRPWHDKENNILKLSKKVVSDIAQDIARSADGVQISDKVFDRVTKTSQNDMNRLMYTEDTREFNEAVKDVLIHYYEKYYLVTAHDSKVCDVCRDLEGQIFDFTHTEVGVNFPPIHPWCRCRIFPFTEIELEEIEE